MSQQQSTNWNPCLEQAALSDIGLRRANNQDSMAVVIAPTREKFERRGHLFVVADGMGAHAGGELASKLAADIIPLAYHKLPDRPPSDALREAVLEANRQIHNRGQASDDFRGMGTTVDALALLVEGALIAHVGDSRVYRWRDNRMEQLTFDHSLVWEMRAASRWTKEDIPPYVPRNIITRSMGPNPDVRVDIEGPFPIKVGDTFLLCSDGLSGPLQDDEMGKILGSLPPAEAVQSLVDLANLRGGPDNITAIVARVTCPFTADGSPAPESLGARCVSRSVFSALGIAVALGALGLVLLGMGSTTGFLIGLLGGLAAAAAAVYRFRGRRRDRPVSGLLLSRSPYAQVDCAADAEFTKQLADLVKQLRDAAVSDGWTVEWSRFDALQAEADSAVTSRDFTAAVRTYCRAINFMMDQLKHQDW